MTKRKIRNIWIRSMFAGNITEKRVDRFSWNYHDLDMTQETNGNIRRGNGVSRMERLFHVPQT